MRFPRKRESHKMKRKYDSHTNSQYLIISKTISAFVAKNIELNKNRFLPPDSYREQE